MLRLQNITKVYNNGRISVQALRDINFHIKPGEFVAIMGPSGSGKSTLMNILGCLDRPTTGSYKLDNKEVARLSDAELAEVRNKYIGFIFQSFNLLPKLSALQNVELPLIYAGVTGRERARRARKALEDVGLAERMHHRPTELSGGQQQRVAIARALVNQPKLILADEPTGNLDSKSGLEIMQILDQLNKEGNTIVMVTHDPQVAAWAGRLIEVYDGCIKNDRLQEQTARMPAEVEMEVEMEEVGGQ
ncbi:MAG TPA: ABC transporter ATP-binding protein [Firmicutes bacterium]|nr:ABC transporter ATP-binding protein [Bacillota bacterium]